ncbi:DUF2889 domain-containing protein [Sphingobium sp. V4]|uniref:DUF2889 domain-containing protein n=1 Tax=Sphingobium sp. V4 TaxID=3038927 RepID=UPI002557DFD4|nr:DUF2889 domain-containing protein [Sphingobium sp. V4]WIW89440.1 DUF2889 domain-containing protein [Sphingobium sp. V4]
MKLIETSPERFSLLAAPARKPWSIRRTTSIQLSWPDGGAGSLQLHGHGRDLLTRRGMTDVEILMADNVHAVIDQANVIASIETVPALPADLDLVGQHARSGFRRAIAPAVSDPAYRARPLALLLDDFVGANIISGWIKVKWVGQHSGWNRGHMEDVCVGYAAGSTAFDDFTNLKLSYIVPPMEPYDDPLGFHELGPDVDGTVRRLRRIDVWFDDGRLMMDALFQDSGVLHDPVHRSAIHEYRLQASAERANDGWRLSSISAEPGTLPYTECRGAPLNLKALVGSSLAELRQTVLAELRGPLGCTHLNDAVRSLSEAGMLADRLQTEAFAGRGM